jgi:hypothetical protein
MDLNICKECSKRDCCQRLEAYLLGFNRLSIEHAPDIGYPLGLSVEIGGTSIGRIQAAKLLPGGTLVLGIKKDYVDKLLEETCLGEQDQK